MLYLILAIAASTSIIVLFKIFGKLKVNAYNAIIINYVVATTFGLLSESSEYSLLEIPLKPWFILSIIVGFLFIVNFNLYALSARYAGVALTGMASRMSMILAVLAGLLFFGDKPGLFQIVGIVLGIVAFYLTFYRKNGSDVSFKVIVLPLSLWLIQGINELFLKVGQEYYIQEDFKLFLATVFASALVFGLIFLMLRPAQQARFTYRELAGGIVIGLVNWYSGYFLLLGLSLFDVSFVIPVVNVGVVAASALLGFFVFSEKLTAFNWMGVLLALIAIFLMIS